MIQIYNELSWKGNCLLTILYENKYQNKTQKKVLKKKTAYKIDGELMDNLFLFLLFLFLYIIPIPPVL